MAKKAVLKDRRTKEVVHPQTQVAQVEGLEQYVSEHGMSAGDKAKLDALPTNATLESTYATKTELTQAISGLYGEFYKN